MDLQLNGKVALVAASSQGIGKACALALAGEGCRVICNGRTEATLQAAVEDIRSQTGADVHGIAADVTRADEIERLVREAKEKFGPIEILVTNAGGPPPGQFMDMTEAQWQAAFDLTLMSTVRLIRAVIPDMQAARWGRIINITSVSVKQPIDGLLLSNSYRAAVIGLAKTLSNEIGPDGITVNTIAPGYTLTGRLEELFENRAKQSGKSVETIQTELAQGVPLRRLGQPAEIGNLAAFLASAQAAYMTGTVIAVDGGYVKGL